MSAELRNKAYILYIYVYTVLTDNNIMGVVRIEAEFYYADFSCSTCVVRGFFSGVISLK